MVVVVSVTGGCGAKDRCVGLTQAPTHDTCTPANGKRGAVRTRTGVWGNSCGLRGNVVYLDRLVEAELLLLRDGWTRQERVVSERFVGHGRWDQGSRTRFPPYIITSWFIAVRMLRLGRLRRHGARRTVSVAIGFGGGVRGSGLRRGRAQVLGTVVWLRRRTWAKRERVSKRGMH